VHLQQVLCNDTVIRDDAKGRKDAATGERRVSSRAWCGQYNIPRRTFEHWLEVHQDPRHPMRDGRGKANLLDENSKVEAVAVFRELQTATETHEPQPAKSKKVREILVNAAMSTLIRAGKTQFSGEKVTMCSTTFNKYRDMLTNKRKAHDISNARYQTLNNTQHMYQSAVMFVAATSHLTGEQKWNFDCTTFTIQPENNGKVSKSRFIN
jgi:hypothetical protein